MKQLNEQVVLITGAKGGLGSFVTEAFLEAGATVVGSSKSIQASDFPCARFTAMAADLTDAASAQQLSECVSRRFQKIDALVHVMGGFAGGTLIEETDDGAWERMMNLNLRSAFHILRAVIPNMRQAGGGRIVAIGSRQAVDPQAGTGAYSASKAALVSLIRTAALENRDSGITANVILPGTMNTEANRKSNPDADVSQWVPPADVARIATFLTSPEAAQITGAAIPVYGKGA